MAALGREEGWRRGRRRISGQRLRSIELLKSQGMSNRAVAHRLGVTRSIPNPERHALDKEVRAARPDLAKLEREYGAAAADNAEQQRPTMRGVKIAHGTLGKRLRKHGRAISGRKCR
jgi:transposase-like protein